MLTQNEPSAPIAADNILRSIAEQLKLPLLHIARQAELGGDAPEKDRAALQNMQTSAESALNLVDSYLLGLQLVQDQSSLALEPVTLSSVLLDAAHELDAFARQYGVLLELEITGRFAPVMAHRAGLRATFLSLGYALIEALPSLADARHHRLTLATHRTPAGVIAGLYTQGSILTTEQFRVAQGLCGKARQPLTGLSPSSGAGVFVADAILRAMASCLRVGRYQNMTGLAATLQPSQQLQLV
ncbi:MAG TPA: hypothetical protein VHT70_00350 [Candidatus Saccharimonadales bacterium]|nr:hypothetical protein [Candidatus Saccharimonadales bacterium]